MPGQGSARLSPQGASPSSAALLPGQHGAHSVGAESSAAPARRSSAGEGAGRGRTSSVASEERSAASVEIAETRRWQRGGRGS